MPAIADGDRLAPDRPVGREVLVGDEPASALHLRDDEVGHPTAVEPVGAGVADRLQRGREVGLQQRGADRGRRAARAGSSRARRGSWRAARCRSRMEWLRYSSTTKPSRARRIAGRITESNGSRPSARWASTSPAARARHAGREVAGDAQLGRLADGVEVHVARGAARRGLPVVERAHRAVGRADHHEPAAADVAGLGVHHRERESHRHRRVHRVAARAQHVATDLARERMARHDHRRRRPPSPAPCPSSGQSRAMPAAGSGAPAARPAQAASRRKARGTTVVGGRAR